MPDSIPDLAARLYDECLNTFPADHLFNQQELLGLGVIPKDDIAVLLQCAQSLVNQVVSTAPGDEWQVSVEADFAGRCREVRAPNHLI